MFTSVPTARNKQPLSDWQSSSLVVNLQVRNQEKSVFRLALQTESWSFHFERQTPISLVPLEKTVGNEYFSAGTNLVI